MKATTLLLPTGISMAALIAIGSDALSLGPHAHATSSTVVARPTPEPPWLTAAWTAELDAEASGSPHASHGPHAAETAQCPGMTGDETAGSVDDPHLAARHSTLHDDRALPSVARSSADNGYTVAGLFARRTDLDAARVRVRGIVVQVNDGILGRNFVHLRDGTGNAESSDHDLTLTTSEHFDPGEEVEIEGVLALDRDFGLGYRYAALVEQATRL